MAGLWLCYSMTLSSLLSAMSVVLAGNLGLQTDCQTFLNIDTNAQENGSFKVCCLWLLHSVTFSVLIMLISCFQDFESEPKMELLIGDGSENETANNLATFLSSLEKLSFRGCLGIVVNTDDKHLLNAIIKAAASTR